MDNPRARDEERAGSTSAGGSKNISVFCRLKPQSSSEEIPSSFAVEDGKTIRINYPVASSPPKDLSHKTGATKASLVFTYNRVYGETSSQKLIFDEVGKPLVEDVCNGINATVLAYGTTASGKTYTILGPRIAPACEKVYPTSGTRAPPSSKPHFVRAIEPKSQQEDVQREGSLSGVSKVSSDEYRHWQRKQADSPAYSGQGGMGREHSEDGLLPRMIFYVFDCVKRKTNTSGTRTVKAAAMEVYNDSIVDLVTGRRGLKIHKPKMGQVSVVGLHEEVLLGPESGISFLERVVEGRKTAATNVNAESSRSHFIFWLVVQETAPATGSSTKARLSVVDLAGSERLAKTNTCGGTQVEGAMINKSLTCLGKVISCLASLNEARREYASGAADGYQEVPYFTQQHRTPCFIPYRDSKLTRVLQDSLGGNSHTSIVLTCSQEVSHLAENIPTLRFGQRALLVKNSPKVNEVAGHGRYELQRDISRYQNYVRELASWGETAIVKLTERTRSATGKLCGGQNKSALGKAGGPSKSVGMKRANTSIPDFVRNGDSEQKHAEVVDELLSGFPAPPKALQLDFIKDDVAMNIRHRLQHELVPTLSVDETQAVTHKPGSVAAVPVPRAVAGSGICDMQVATVNRRPLSVGRTTDPSLLVGQRFMPFNSEEQGDSASVLVKGSVGCSRAEPRQISGASGGCNRVTPTSSTIRLYEVYPEGLKSRQASSLLPHATQEANETGASTASCSCEIFQHYDMGSTQRLDLSPCRKQADDVRSSRLGCLSDYSRKHDAMQSLEPMLLTGREHTTRRVSHTGADSACPEARSNAQPAAPLKLRALWQAATSWVSHVKGLQSLFPARVAKLDTLRRATQVDDAIRLKQRLLLCG